MSVLTKILKPFDRFLPEENRLELIWLLAKMEFSKRYYDSVLGLFWALINPLMRVAVYYVAFTYFVDAGGDIENFGLYLFSGLILLMFFSEGTSKAMKLLKSKRHLSENAQFERMDLFVASSIGSLLGFFFSCGAFVVFSFVIGAGFPSTVVYFPILAINMYFIVLGFSLIVAIIHVFFKDIDQLWAIINLVLFWTSPIFFRGDKIAEVLPFLPYVNPFFGIMKNVRAVVIHGTMPDFFFLAYSYIYAFVVMFIGVKLFRKYSHKALEKTI